MKPPEDRQTPTERETVTKNDTNELEQRHDINGGTMHPEAVQTLPETIAVKQSVNEQAIDRIERDLAALGRGDTDWQREVKAVLATMANQLHVLTLARVVRPGVLAVVFAGLLCAELMWRFATH